MMKFYFVQYTDYVNCLAEKSWLQIEGQSIVGAAEFVWPFHLLYVNKTGKVLVWKNIYKKYMRRQSVKKIVSCVHCSWMVNEWMSTLSMFFAKLFVFSFWIYQIRFKILMFAFLRF